MVRTVTMYRFTKHKKTCLLRIGLKESRVLRRKNL